MKIMIIGATSAIAHETANFFAKDGAEFFLVGRNAEKLEDVRNDLRIRGARRVEIFLLDITALERHEELINTALVTLDGLDAVLIAHGTLANQRKCEQSVSETLKEFTTNCTSVISLLTLLANFFEQQRRGCIAVLSSIAGDRGQRGAYVYGTAKGAVSLFLQGQRSRLYKSGVAVVTIKLGYVDTPMTASLKRGLKTRVLFASARSAAKGVYQAMKQGKDVVYLPWFWRPITLLIKSIPESIFKRR
jgi:decaprenylphospho-beta-D-erythro-pentofuranosid-2-ulose 2-reductase